MRTIPFTLGDGGPFYDPDDPLLAHPSIRAAAHLLAAADRVAPATRASLRKDVLPLHPPTPRLLRSPRLALDPSGATFTAPPDAPDPSSRPVVRQTLDYLDALLAWARHRHLASPYVLELLLLVLDAWHGLDRTLALCDADSEHLRRQPPSPALIDSLALLDRRRSRLAAATAGWSFWIDLLTTTNPETPFDPLLQLPDHLRRVAPRRTPSPDLVLHAPAWQPELEPWATAEERLRSAFDDALSRHRDLRRPPRHHGPRRHHDRPQHRRADRWPGRPARRGRVRGPSRGRSGPPARQGWPRLGASRRPDPLHPGLPQRRRP